MGVAAAIGQQIAEEAVYEPRQRFFTWTVEEAESDFEFVDSVGTCFVDTRSLAGGADEDTRRKQIRE